MDNISKFKKYYEHIFKGINSEIDNYNSNLLDDKSNYLKENLKYFTNLNSGGKLIRGFLIALGYDIASSKDVSYSYKLALAYEIFQTSVLVHDDIIDEDKLRRGKETIHHINYLNDKKYNDSLAKKIGDSIGICMGDYGFFEANNVIVDNYKNDKNFSKIFRTYNDIVLKTIEGELIDVKLSFDGRYKLDETDLESNIMLIYKNKTAYYTIIGPLTLGLILGGIDDKKLKVIQDFGEKVGIAFQIQDDILGIYNDMGKVIGSDIKEYKQTLLFSKTMENKEYRDKLLEYYGKDVNEKEINKVREIFKDSGAYDYAYNLMNKLYDEALVILDKIDWMSNDNKDLLYGFVEYLRNRKK
jgi:geranylgeranyl diphosphate synthase type I